MPNERVFQGCERVLKRGDGGGGDGVFVCMLFNLSESIIHNYTYEISRPKLRTVEIKSF